MSKPESFPRSVPYRAPDANHHPLPAPATSGISKSQMILMASFCGLFLFAGLGVGLLAVRANAPRQDPPPDRGKDTTRTRLTERQDPLPPAHDPVKESQDTLSAPGLKDTEPAKDNPKVETPASLPQGGKVTSQPGTPVAIPDTVAEAIGALATAQLYQTYLNIGLLADSVEGEVYEKEEARRLLDTVAGLMTAVDQQLDRVSRQALKGDEKKAVEQARQVAASLRTQTRELTAYWDKGEKDNVTRFHQARQDSWTGIKSLLNIQE